MFVADTNVISMSDPRRAPALAPSIDLTEAAMYISTITVAEVRAGIHKLERTGATRRATEFAMWWYGVEVAYGDRILPFDFAAARIAGQLADRAASQGHDPGWADIQIAAIAVSRGFAVLTQNKRHFAPLGVSHYDPFMDDLPG